MPFQIIRNDITKVRADAIVNTANPEPVIGAGTDAAIYHAAGRNRLLEERKKIGDIAPGQTAYTQAFKLNAKYILHTVGPAWIDGQHGELEILHSAYKKSLELAAELSCESIAFPLMATGSYGFPKDEALKIALAEINQFLLEHDMQVLLVVFDRKAFELSGKLVGDIDEYISEHEVREIRQAEYDQIEYNTRRDRRIRRRKKEEKYAQSYTYPLEEASPSLAEEESAKDASAAQIPQMPDALAPSASPSYAMPPQVAGAAKKKAAKREAAKESDSIAGYFPNFKEKSLDELLRTKEKTFQERLFELIDESGMDDVTVYKKANIDRKLFSKIRSKEDYKPKKKTAVAFAIALELDMPTMLDLLSRAGFAFSPSDRFDLIITYFINHGIYDIFEINAALFKYGQPILGE